MSKQKLITYLSVIFLLFSVSVTLTTPAGAGSPQIQNKLHLEPQMSWPMQWDKVKGQSGNFWVCGQNSGFVTIWDDKTMEKVAHVDFWEYEKNLMIKAGKKIDEKTEDWIQKNVRPHHGWLAPGGKYFYVSNNSKKSDVFWVMDTKTFKIVARFNTGGIGPLHGAFSPTEDLAIWGNVQDKEKGVITFIDTKNHKVIDVVKTTGVQTRDINITHDGKRVFVANQGWDKEKGIKGSIDVFDIKSRKLIKSITGAQGLKGMSMSKDGKTIVAAGRRQGKAYIIDVDKMEIRATVDVGGSPSNVSFHPTQPKVYLGLYKTNDYVVIDLKTNKLVKRIPGGKEANALYFPVGRDDIAYGANEKDTFVSVIDTINDKVITEMDTPLGSHNIRFRPDGKIGFASCKRSNEGVFFDAVKMEVVKTVEVGFGNNGVRWVPKAK
jgi:DNA-binding beta-propeller fold protein YncE